LKKLGNVFYSTFLNVFDSCHVFNGLSFFSGTFFTYMVYFISFAMNAVHEATRESMQTYWQTHSKEASVKEMMLDSNAEELGKEEIPEIMSMMPDTSGMDVLELGAGIG